MTDCLHLLLRTASRKATALYDAALAEQGLTVAQYSLLRRIRSAGRPSLTELAQLADLDRSTIGRNVRVLAEMRLVHLEPGADQRQARVALSDLAQARLAACADPWATVQARVEQEIGPDGLAALRAFSDAR